MYPNKHLVTHILTTFSKTYPKIGAILVALCLVIGNLKEMREKENKEEKKKVKENKK